MPNLRMPDVNHVILAGRLLRDPEVRYTSTGVAICVFGIAVGNTYKGKDGTKKENTVFLDVTVWDKNAEYCGIHLKKGRPVLVEGSLKTNSWTDKASGQKRSKVGVFVKQVQQLDWDDRGESSESMGNQDPIDEEDVAF